MKRWLIVCLVLLASGGICVFFVRVSYRATPEARTFHFVPQLTERRSLPRGEVIDVISARQLLGGEGFAETIAERVQVVDVHDGPDVDGTGLPSEAITLLVTPTQAAVLEEAQWRGTLHHALHEGDELRRRHVPVREFLGLETPPAPTPKPMWQPPAKAEVRKSVCSLLGFIQTLPRPLIVRTFRVGGFASNGFLPPSGIYGDVLGDSVQFADGTGWCKCIVQRAFVLKWDYVDSRSLDHRITLLLTPAEVKNLEQAQRRGPVRWSWRADDDRQLSGQAAGRASDAAIWAAVGQWWAWSSKQGGK